MKYHPNDAHIYIKNPVLLKDYQLAAIGRILSVEFMLTIEVEEERIHRAPTQETAGQEYIIHCVSIKRGPRSTKTRWQEVFKCIKVYYAIAYNHQQTLCYDVADPPRCELWRPDMEATTVQPDWAKSDPRPARQPSHKKDVDNLTLFS